MEMTAQFRTFRSDLDEIARINTALEKYADLLEDGDISISSPTGKAIRLGMESIDPSINLKEGTSITLRAIKEGLVVVAKATREMIRKLYELLMSLYVKFTGSLKRVRGQQRSLSARLGRLGNRVTYKPMELGGINRLSINGEFMGHNLEVLKSMEAVSRYLLRTHPATVVKVARSCARNFVTLVENNPTANMNDTAREGMLIFGEILGKSMSPVYGATELKPNEMPNDIPDGKYLRSAVMPGNTALIYTDPSKIKIDAGDSSNYASIIRNAFFIDYKVLPLNTADDSVRSYEVPSIKTLSSILDEVSRVLEIAEKSELGRRDFATVKMVVDDAIRQVMDIDTGNGKPNNVVIQMLGSISETLASPMTTFTHWLAVTLNVYLNYVAFCIKHYEDNGV